MAELVDLLLASAGGRREPSLSSMVRSVRAGVPIARAERTFRSLHLTLDEASRSLGLTLRTLQRRKAQGRRLDPVESEKVLRLARVADAAIEALGDRSAAGEWLRLPNAALGGATPLSLLDTDVGAAAVVDVLTRLEYGVHG